MIGISNPLDRAARRAMGLAARRQVARSAHRKFDATSSPHATLDLLRDAESGRILRLLAIKHERMAASAFGFFRGAVPVMAADLAAHPNTGIFTQLCGDAHVSNLGAFATLDGNLSFDINDFDETIRGPFEFDLKRLAVSIVLAGRDAGIKRAARRDALLHFASRYRMSMHNFSTLPILEVARYQIHRLAQTDPMPAILHQAERSTPQRSLEALTAAAEHTSRNAADRGVTRKFRSNPPLLARLPADQAESVVAALTPYAATLQPERRHFLAQYHVVDVAFKVVGTGSVGLRDYCVYLENPAREPGSDPLFLQIKEETPSAWARWLPEGADAHTHQGQRVVDGQRAMQLSSDPFLGYTTLRDAQGISRDYLVRQLNDHKATLELDTLTADSLLGYADLCGELFARGHARAGDPVAIAAYLGSSARFDDALVTFARTYADKAERDYALFKKAYPVQKSKGRGKSTH